MRGYFALGQLSATDKSDILDQHKSVYNGYQTMQPQVSNTQPLTVYDFAGDKEGLVVNNKGEVKKYTNMGINESVEEGEMCEQCGGQMNEGICEQCGESGEMEEETGHLDDIYDEEDLSPTAGFDYIEGGGNDYGTFEGMHHMKEQNGEVDELSTHELEKGKKYKYNSPSFDDEVEFDDEVDDKRGGDKMYKFKGKDAMNHLMAGKGVERFLDYLDLDEQGGNADDMDVDDVKPAFDFESEGPMNSGVSPMSEDEFEDLTAADAEIEGERDELDEVEYESMESAFSDEIDEVDVSGSQGVYGDMDPAFDFDSEGPGKAGPYQHSEYNEGAYVIGSDGKPRDKKPSEKISAFSLEDFDDDDYEEDELEVDFDTFDPREKSWEEITAHTGDDEFGGVDEDIRESLIGQKNRIMEMMNRMKIIK